jgi:hypothetical protein
VLPEEDGEYQLDRYIQSRRTDMIYIQSTEGRLTGLATSGIGTAFYNMLLKERQKEG